MEHVKKGEKEKFFECKRAEKDLKKATQKAAEKQIKIQMAFAIGKEGKRASEWDADFERNNK